MFDDFDNVISDAGFNSNPARISLVGYGYDPESYISTAKLIPSDYTSQSLVSARIGGLNRLIEAVDDSQPPTGTLNQFLSGGQILNPAYATYLAIIQNVVTEINGYLSSIYPLPLAQTGTIATLEVTAISNDGLGVVAGIEMIEAGNYLTAPAVDQFPVYLRHLDPNANSCFFGSNWFDCQNGQGLELTVAYSAGNYSDESGQVLQSKSVNGTPIIANGGTNYQIGDKLVLIGGSSFVPAKIRQAALDLVCHSLYQRRLAPEEKNLFSESAKTWRKFLTKIGEGDMQLDGTYKRFYSAGASWNTRSVFAGANSL